MANISTKSKESVRPSIVYGRDQKDYISIDPLTATQVMRELGVSESGIANSVIYIDYKNRLLNNGTHYPNKLGRLRFFFIPELRGVKGDIVRLSTKVRGKERTASQMNKTITHEWEHLAQDDRKDIKVIQGHITIYGLAIVSILAGGFMGGMAGAFICGLLGYQIGYWLAPHERQARLRSGQIYGLNPTITSGAVKRI